MTEEQFLHEQLARLRREYEVAAEPIVRRLVGIASLRTSPSLLVDFDALDPAAQAMLLPTEVHR